VWLQSKESNQGKKSCPKKEGGVAKKEVGVPKKWKKKRKSEKWWRKKMHHVSVVSVAWAFR
jgi:hypothetical protein